MAEAIRMAEAVADPSTVDPELAEDSHFAPLITPSDIASTISATGEDVVHPCSPSTEWSPGICDMGTNTELYSSASQRPEKI